MRRLMLVGVVLLGAIGAVIWPRGSAVAPPAAEVPLLPPVAAGVGGSHIVAGAPGDQWQEVARLDGEHAVDDFLGRIEAAARRRRQVTTADVQSGFLALDRLRNQLGAERVFERKRAFGQKMAALSDEVSLN